MNSAGVPNASPEQKGKNVRPVLGLIIVLVLIVIVGLFIWSSKTSYAPSAADQNYENQAEISPEKIRTQGTSDEFSAIERDLNNFNEEDIENISSELE